MRKATRRAPPFQQDLWHYTIAKMVDACAAAGIKPFYGPFGDFSDRGGMRGAIPQRVPDGLPRRLVAASVADRNRQAVFSPDPAEVAFARKIVAAMPDGAGAVMIDGKMQDDATWKQAKVRARSCPAGRRQGSGDGRALRPLTAAGECHNCAM